MQFKSEEWLPAPRPDVFRFFADASNLEAITPPWLHFRLVTPVPVDIRQDAVIDYRLRVHGIPIRWQSVITVWDPPHRFVDEQRRGPYRRWVHTHDFIEERGGTTVRDSVEFDVPLAPLSRWFVERDVRRIFAYRRDALRARFSR
jgi:ligand-binding SRPBCC domain-containing protein